MVGVEELQEKLNRAQLYIDIGRNAEAFQTKIVNLFTKLGFQASPRAEGFAFFPGVEEAWKRLPSIRLTKAGSVVTLRVHASDSLTTMNVGAVRSTPDAVYERIIEGMVAAGKLYKEQGKKASYVSVTSP